MVMSRFVEADKTFYFKANNRYGQITDNVAFGTLEGYLVEYPKTKASTVYTLRLNAEETIPANFEKAGFMLDDGYSIKPYYIAGYSADKTEFYIHPVSAGTLAYLGPKTMYFLTVQSTNKG